MYAVELCVTPRNKNGKWSKRHKNYKVAGFPNKQAALDKKMGYVKHTCKLMRQNTNVFFAEILFLKDDSYVDCDSAIVRLDTEKDNIEIITI